MINFVKKTATIIFFFVTLMLLWLIFNFLHAYGPSKFQLLTFPQPHFPAKLGKSSRADLNINYSGHQSTSTGTYCQNKTKIMFTKNAKVAGTTISSILIQIASHYHKYEILKPSNLNSLLNQKNPKYGYLVSHMPLQSIPKFEKVFPKEEFLWISTTRNVADQIISFIKFLNLQNFYTPSSFDKTLNIMKKQGKHGRLLQPFWSGGTGHILHSCRGQKDFEIFKSCAKNVFKKFDLIIPVDRMNEGLVMLHKMTCLPLSDFAYTNKKISSKHFSMDPKNHVGLSWAIDLVLQLRISWIWKTISKISKSVL